MPKNKLKILITTGIYPPQIGGPATYAKNLKESFLKLGHEAVVKTFRFENRLPTGIRHIFFFFKILPAVSHSDYVVALDTFSVGLPTMFSCWILGKKGVIRTGGDFLHEQYLERTKELIPLDDFYAPARRFSLREKIIFFLTKKTLKMAKVVVFSTNYQKNIFLKPYGLDGRKVFIVENYYGTKLPSVPAASKIFLWPVRNLVFKNGGYLKKAFAFAQSEYPDIYLDERTYLPEELARKIKNCYAVILPSVSDISPNLILEAIKYGKPFIITKNNGLKDRIGGISVEVNPLNIADIKSKILFLADDGNYQRQKEKMESFNFTHSWEEIAAEFLSVYMKIVSQ